MTTSSLSPSPSIDIDPRHVSITEKRGGMSLSTDLINNMDLGVIVRRGMQLPGHPQLVALDAKGVILISMDFEEDYREVQYMGGPGYDLDSLLSEAIAALTICRSVARSVAKAGA